MERMSENGEKWLFKTLKIEKQKIFTFEMLQLQLKIIFIINKCALNVGSNPLEQ